MRNVLLASKQYTNTEIDVVWEGNPILILDVVSSEKQNKEYLKENRIYLALTSKPLIFLDEFDFVKSRLNPDLIIFASRHTSATAKPAFLVHTTGNWSSNNDFGGNPKDLSKTSALLHKAGFHSLKAQFNKYNLAEFSVDIEVTHHGPTTFDVPLIFMELGSSKQEWIIKEAGELVANAIINTVFKYLDYKKEDNQHVALGFGGTHYAPNFKRLLTNNNIALSFICPKHYIRELNKEFIEQMINNTLEEIDYFIVDWKGTNSENKKHLIPLLEKFDIPIRKTKNFSIK
ncbi:MAG: D-aminoacyl-tRNA deacylase [Candidatus Hermodarchaeota archaeon]